MSVPVLALEGVTKRFGETDALVDLSIALAAGEVHAVVGENGAGKSTMIKVMTGVHRPDAGTILIDGAGVAFGGPHDAREHGITAIYQEPMVFPDLDVAENVFIGSTREGRVLDRRRLRREARALIGRIGMRLDVERVASGLTLAEQQAVEIARALSQRVRVLIMDEPTAALSAHEAAVLRGVARALADEGVAIVYISHRLEEIFEIADRVTVLRDGRQVSSRALAATDADTMIAEMVGREVGDYFARVPSRLRPDEPLLEVRDLAREGVFSGIDFTLRRGEILCMAGLVGARRTDVALALFGIAPPTAGTVLRHGRALRVTSPREAMDAGIAYVSEDRRKLGLAMTLSVRANVTLATLDRHLTRLGLVDRAAETRTALAFRERLNIRVADVEAEVGTLSGGNQQKVMLAKWLAAEPELLIFDEPTRGIDVGAKAEVHDLIRAFVAAGGAALVISSDLPEVLALADRVLVMREGRQTGVIDGDTADGETIMALATGRGLGPLAEAS